MPHAFSQGFQATRPNAELFVVPRLPEKEYCSNKPLPIDDDADLDDKVSDWVQKLLDHDDVHMASESSIWSDAPMSLTSLVAVAARAEAWGSVDPRSPTDGFKPACLLSGPGVNIKMGQRPEQLDQVRPLCVPSSLGAGSISNVGSRESVDTTSEDFPWTEVDVDLLTEDTSGVPIEQGMLPAVGTSGYACSINLNPPFLYWAARQKYMWHRKWAIPTITVEVRRLPTTPALRSPMHVMLSAGTLRDDAPGLHDTGLAGRCQVELELDEYGYGSVRFPRILFKHTSFTCGSRPFHLVVTILAAPPVTALGADSSFSERASGSPSSPPGAMNRISTWNQHLAAATAGPGIEAAPNSPPRIPIIRLISTPIQVDARKRSKGERSDAAPDDVRLLQRPHALGSNTQAAQAARAVRVALQCEPGRPQQKRNQQVGGSDGAQKLASHQKEITERQAATAMQWLEQQQAATAQHWARQQGLQVAAQQFASYQEGFDRLQSIGAVQQGFHETSGPQTTQQFEMYQDGFDRLQSIGAAQQRAAMSTQAVTQAALLAASSSSAACFVGSNTWSSS